MGLKSEEGWLCSDIRRKRVHRMFCLKMFIACKKKTNMKEAEGENLALGPGVQALGQGGTLPWARSRWGWETAQMKPTK